MWSYNSRAAFFAVFGRAKPQGLKTLRSKNPEWEHDFKKLWRCYFTEYYTAEDLDAATGGVYKKGLHKNFTKFTGKYLCQSLF